jgi:hypothetical protein
MESKEDTDFLKNLSYSTTVYGYTWTFSSFKCKGY